MASALRQVSDALVHRRPRFALLGPLALTGRDGAPVPVRGRRTRELLAVLVLSSSQTVTAERLVDCLWGQQPPAGAFITLRTYVGQARQALAAAGFGPQTLITRDGGYALRIDPADVDAEVFERLVSRGQEALALGEAHQARASLQAGLDLWRGEVLADLGGPIYAEAFAGRLHERRVDAWEALIDSELALGMHREVVSRAQALVSEHPFREHLTAQLVLALYRSGRQADALAAYAATKHRLAEDLGVDPGGELRDLERAVLRQDPVLHGPTSPRPTATPVLPDAVLAALRRSAMVGRTSELARLRRGWDAALAGGTASAFVYGQAGVGKSRLVAELAGHAADSGATVLVGRCEEPTVAHQAITSALEGFEEQAGALGRQAVQDRVHVWRSTCAVLSGLAAQRGLLLVIEDADRLDDATALLLRYVLVHPPARVMVVVSYREPPGSAHPPLAALITDRGVVDVADRMPLAPLSEVDLRELVTDVTGSAPDSESLRRLHQQTGGNPFFAVEVLRAGVIDEVPPGVRDMLGRRLAALPEPARHAVEAAAVMGLEVPLLRLGRLLEVSEVEVLELLGPAIAAGVVLEAGQSWLGAVAFPHGLMREAVYAQIPRPARERWHLRAAAVMTLGPSVTDQDRMAQAVHLRLAAATADRLEAARACLEAAGIARRLLAWDEAIVHGEAAISLLSGTGSPSEDADARIRLSLTLMQAGRDYGRAVRLLEDALAIQVRAGNLADAGLVHSRLGGALTLHHAVMDIPRALEHFRAAERLLPAAETVFNLHRGRAQAAMYGVQTDLLLQASIQIQHLAESLSRPDLSVFGLWGRAWHALDTGQVEAAFDLLEQGWAVARDLGSAYLAWGPVNAAALFATEFLLDPVTGRAWARRGLGQPRFDAFRQPHVAVVDQLALALLAMGEVAAAQDVAASLPDDAQARRVLHLRCGRPQEAAQEWTAAVAQDERAGNRLDALVNRRWLAESLLALGEEDPARQVLHEGLQTAITGPQVPSEVWIRARLARLDAFDAAADAEAHLSRCAQILDSGQDWAGLRGHIGVSLACVHAARGRWGAAHQVFEESLAIFARYRLAWHADDARQAWELALARGTRSTRTQRPHASLGSDG